MTGKTNSPSFYDSTIHGVKIMLSSFGAMRLLSIIVFCSCVGFCLSQVADTVKRYLSNETKTIVTFEEFDRINFPAITFCPGSLFVRNAVGRADDTIAWAYANVNGFGDLGYAKLIGGKICSDPNATMAVENLMVEEHFSKILFDSYRMVKRCLFNGNDLDCGKIFLNHQAELGWCFTFNPAAQIIDQYINESRKLKTYGYGTTVDDIQEYLVHGGMRNSLTFIMDVSMNQTCVPILQNAVGVGAFAHDSPVEPFLSTKRLTLLSPGFATNVAISVIRTHRYTESLGKCLSAFKPIYNKNITAYRSKDAYLVDCLTDVVVRKCGCLPYFSAPPSLFSRYFDEGVCAISTRTIGRGKCMDDAIKKEYLEDRTCYKHIPTPCNEVSVVSSNPVSAKFPAANTLASLKRSLNAPADMSLEEFRQNYLLVNFYLKNKKVTLIREYPKMTWIDLLNQCGGTMGMCLGMSMLSVLELMSLGLARAKNSIGPAVRLLHTRSTSVRYIYLP